MLLFYAADVDGESDEADACRVRRRSEVAEGRENDHVVVHVFRVEHAGNGEGWKRGAPGRDGGNCCQSRLTAHAAGEGRQQ